MPAVGLQQFEAVVGKPLNFPGAGRGNGAKTLAGQSASQFGTPPLAEIFDRFICQGIKFSRRDILLKLPVPCGGIALVEPRPKLREFFRCQPLHRSFKFDDRRHAGIISIVDGQTN